MEMKQCASRGHYYDAALHDECPHCKAMNVGATMPLTPGGGEGHTRAMGVSDEGRTKVLMQEELGVDPVVGWLVSLDGREKGRDYRIHAENNYMGRGENMDICIRGDDTISRENHAVISYDPRDNAYYFSPGDGRSIVRLNDKAIFVTAELAAYDIIEIGKTKLMFVPLCGERFLWS